MLVVNSNFYYFVFLLRHHTTIREIPSLSWRKILYRPLWQYLRGYYPKLIINKSAFERIEMEKDISKIIFKQFEKNGTVLISGSKAAKKIIAFLKINGLSRKDIENFFQHPEQTLGPFDALSKHFSNGLANAANFHIQEIELLTNPVVRTLAYGSISKLGAYFIHLGRKLKGHQLESMDHILIRIGRKIIRTCRDLGRAYIRIFRFTWIYRAPFLHMLWQYANVDPMPIIQGYIKNIPIDTRLSPVFKCPDQRVASCGLIGIDFLPSRGKLYFLESNFNPGHYIDRNLLFPEGDTLCNHLSDWAVINGYSKIIFFPHNIQAIFDNDLEDAWRQIAQKRGLHLEIVDDPLIGSAYPRSRRMFMDCLTAGVLYINGRHLTGPLSRLIAEKGLLEQEIRLFNDNIKHNDDKIPVPKAILSDVDVPRVNDDSVFPNIIVKNARLDQTKGIFLYKSRNLPVGSNTWPQIAYEYVVPDLEINRVNGVIGRYVSIFRAYLLITPDGPVYAGARKDISSVAIPTTLPFGMIDEKSPYITNLYVGAYSVAHSEKEDQACQEAVLSIGTVVFRFLKEKHILTVK
jgi:hypothetical protein